MLTIGEGCLIIRIKKKFHLREGRLSWTDRLLAGNSARQEGAATEQIARTWPRAV